MKLILYGLGQGLDLVEDRIKEEHEIIGYMDSYSTLKVFRGKPFYRLENVHQILFDYIVIVIRDGKIAWKIYNMLVKDFGIYESCIIPFYIYANRELHKIKLNACDLNLIRGFIFGNSHAECGFLVEEISIPFLNFAQSSQDIFYNYKIFRTCVDKYGEKIKKLQYIIIDLYDYCYFNLDTSMTSNIVRYMSEGGYLDEHNFKRNLNFKNSLIMELSNISYMPEKASVMEKLFKNVYIPPHELCATERWRHIEEKNSLSRGPVIGSIVVKKSEYTVKENIELLESFLNDIRAFNKKINIIFTLIPRYMEMEQITEIALEAWKEEFYKIINVLCDKYNILFWNYKNRKEISRNNMFYFDVEHLNTVGGRALTAILNHDLKRLEESKKGENNGEFGG